MKCSNCGFDNAEGSKFCSGCGQSLQTTEESPKQEGNNEATVGNTDIVAVLKMPQNRKKIIAAAVAVIAIFFAVKMIGYFNSVEYLEDKLTGNVWYSDTKPGANGSRYGYSLEFHTYGEIEYTWYLGSLSESEMGVFRVSEYEWELMDDKTLKIKGEYYEYEEDWWFNAGEFVIRYDDAVYTLHKSNVGYPK